MPAPNEIEWDEAAAVELAPQNIEWDEAAAQDLSAPAAKPKPGIGETILHQGTAGFFKQWSDEAAGLASRLDPRLQRSGAALDMPDGKTRFINSGDDAQAAATDIERSKLAEQMDKRTALSIGANVGGELLSDFVLSQVGLPVASLPYQLASGALSGAGAADEKTMGGKPGGAAIGAGAALVGHGAGKYVVGPLVQKGGQTLSKLPQLIREMAERRAFKAAGPMLKNFRKVGDIEGAQEVGRDLLDQGIVKFGRNAEEIAEAAAPRVKAVGQQIGDVRQRLDASLPEDVLPTGNAIARQIQRDVLQPLMASPANRRFAGPIKAMADEFAAEGDQAVNMSRLTSWKKDLQDQINYDVPDPAFPHELKKKVARILQGEEDRLARIGLDEDPAKRQLQRFADDLDGIGREAGDDQALAVAERMRQLAKTVGTDTAEYRELKRLYGNLAETAKFSNDQSLRQQANRILSPSDQGLGAAMTAGQLAQGGAQAESTLTGMAVAGANKLLRERGNSASAVMLDKLSRLPGLGWTTKLTGEAAQLMGKYAPALLRASARGPQGIAATMYLLSQKDPELRKLRESADSAPTYSQNVTQSP